MRILEKIKGLVKEKSYKRSFKQAFLITLTGNLFLQGMNIVSGILSARILGPKGKGDLATVIFYPTVLALLGILGLNQSVAYEVSRRVNQEKTIMRAGFWAAIVLGVSQAAAAAIIVPIFLPSDKKHLTMIIQLFMTYVAVNFLSQTLLAVDQGAFRFKRYNFFLALASVGYVVGILISWGMGVAGVFTFALSNLGAHILILIGRIFLSARELFATLPYPSESIRLLKGGLKIYLPYMASIIMSRVDMAILVTKFPADQIGLYVVALAVGMGQLWVVAAFLQVGFVKIAGETERGAALKSFLNQFRAAQIIISAFAVFSVFVAPYVIRYVFGDAFIGALNTSYWLIFAMGAMGLANVLDNGLRAIGYAWIGTVGYGAGIITVLMGGIFFVRPGEVAMMGALMLIAFLVVIIVILFLFSFREQVKLIEMWGFSPSTIKNFVEIFQSFNFKFLS